MRASLTGFRVDVDLRKSWLSIDWAPFSLVASTGNRYQLNTYIADWAYRYYTQLGAGQIEPVLETALMRLNANHWGDAIKYRRWPNGEQQLTYPYRCETVESYTVGDRAGWRFEKPGSAEERSWGWGVRTHIKFWQDGGYVTICLKDTAVVALEGKSFSAGTWLARGTWAGPVSGTGRVYDYADMGIEWSENLQHPSVVVASKEELKRESVTRKDADTREKHDLEKEKATREVASKDKNMKEQEERTREDGGKVVPVEDLKAVAVAPSDGGSSVSSGTSVRPNQIAATGGDTGQRIAGEKIETETFKASVAPKPKPGTSADEAARRPDHRAATDAL